MYRSEDRRGPRGGAGAQWTRQMALSEAEYNLMAEEAHKKFSALKLPRKASIHMANCHRLELEKQGMPPAEIGALRRTGAFYAR